jgi:hypothetical protein
MWQLQVAANVAVVLKLHHVIYSSLPFLYCIVSIVLFIDTCLLIVFLLAAEKNLRYGCKMKEICEYNHGKHGEKQNPQLNTPEISFCLLISNHVSGRKY